MDTKTDDIKNYLSRTGENFPIKNQTNVTKYQQDICEALGVSSVWFGQASKKIPNQHFIDWLLGDQRDYVDSLGLLNRGFCPICGHEPIDKTYRRQFTFGKATEHMCADCFNRMNEDTEAFKTFLPPGYKRNPRGYQVGSQDRDIDRGFLSHKNLLAALLRMGVLEKVWHRMTYDRLWKSKAREVLQMKTLETRNR